MIESRFWTICTMNISPRGRQQLNKKEDNPSTSNSELTEDSNEKITNSGETNELNKNDKKKSVKSEKPENTAKSDSKHEHEKSKIEILGELIDLMKSESKNHEFTTILKNFLEVSNGEESMRRKIVDLVMANLKKCCEKDLLMFAEKCSGFMLPKELLKIITKKNDIIEEKGVLGAGKFATVRKGIFCPSGGSRTVVAIKIANSDMENYLENEAKIMSQLNHPNITKVLAFHEKPQKLVMECMELGDLKNFLLEQTVPLDRLYLMMLSILSGMEYMSEKNFVHRDLRTPNIFINSQLLCKVGDFGLSRYVGYTNGEYLHENGFCVDWAPETRMSPHKFTTKSDVWMMGVVIYDMFSINLCDPDGCDLIIVNMVRLGLIEGRFTDVLKPKNCPKDLYNYLINSVMNKYPTKRPSFTEIIKVINTFKN